jgi:hypothetical protein
MSIGQHYGPVRGVPIDTDHQHPMDFSCCGAMEHILKIRFK